MAASDHLSVDQFGTSKTAPVNHPDLRHGSSSYDLPRGEMHSQGSYTDEGAASAKEYGNWLKTARPEDRAWAKSHP